MSFLLLMSSCQSAPAQARLSAGDARAYAEGRRHEIEFTNSALAMLFCATSGDQRSVIVAGASPDHAEITAAAGVGMRVADYRTLVARVDSNLRGARSLDDRTRRLDSLRVQLIVLRARMNAQLSQQPTEAETSQARRRQCTAPR